MTGLGPRVLAWVPRITFITGVILVGLFALRPISDPDIWWHLKTGEWILTNRSIPQVEIYSHTAAGKPWIAQEWLSQVIFHVAERLLGLNGVRALNAAMAVVLLLLLWLRCRQSHDHRWSHIAAWVACVTLCMPFLSWRPQIFSITIVVFLLPRILNPSQASYSPGRILMLAIGFWIWANLHAMVCLGVFLLAVSWVGVCLQRFFSDCGLRSDEDRQLPVLMGLQLAVVTVAVALTPNGLGVYWFASVGAMLSSQSSLRIVEWLPGAPDWWWMLRYRLLESPFARYGLRDATSLVALGAVVLTLLYSWRVARRNQGRPFVGLLASGACLLAALESRRAAWLLIIPIIWIVMDLRERGRRTHRVDNRRSLGNARLAAVPAVLVLAMTIPVWANAAPWSSLSAAPSIDERQYPVGLADFIADTGMEANLYHSYGWGGYLIWRLSPKCKVFIHGEHVSYERSTPEAVEDYLTVRRKWKRMPHVFRTHNVELCLPTVHRFSEGQPAFCTHRVESALQAVPEFYPPELDFVPFWIRVFVNREGALYLNTQSPRGRANLQRCIDFYAQYGISLSAETGVDMDEVLQKAPEFISQYRLTHDAYKADCRALAEDPSTVRANLRVGDALLRLGLPHRAAKHFQAVLDKRPRNYWGVLGAMDCAHDSKNEPEVRRLLRLAKNQWPNNSRVRWIASHLQEHHSSPEAQNESHPTWRITHDHDAFPDPTESHSSHPGAMVPDRDPSVDLRRGD